MTHDQLIHDLTRRRREMTCEINRLLSQVDQLTDDVKALDRVMLMFRPNAEPETIPALAYRKQPDWARRGELARLIFTVLREADKPLTSIEVTERVMRARGIDDPAAEQKHRKRVYKSLDLQRGRGGIAAEYVDGLLRWRLAG